MRIRADRQTGAGSDRAHQSATNQPLHLRYKRMEAAWLALANEQDWLDGEITPTHVETGLKAKKPPE